MSETKVIDLPGPRSPSEVFRVPPKWGAVELAEHEEMGRWSRRCEAPINRKKLQLEIERVDIPETAMRAAANSVFCSLLCAFEDFGGCEPMSVASP